MKKSFLVCFVLISSLLTRSAMATVYYWEPEGTATPTASNLAGTWNTTAEWSTSSSQSAPVAWSSGVAACFCAGSTTITTPFTVSVNSAISIGGIFNGGLTPPGFFVTLSGSGSLNLVAGQDAFDTSGSDGGTTTIAVPLTGPGQAIFEASGTTYFNAANTFSGGTTLGYSPGGLPTFTGTIYFNNGNAFGTGPIEITSSSAGCTLEVEGTAAITVPNAVTNEAYVNTTLDGNANGLTFSGPWTLSQTPMLGINNLVTISGVMSGVGGLTKNGAGTLVLTGANSFSGGTTISSGVLSVTADNNFGAVPSGASLNITLAGGTLTANSSFAINSTRLISLNANSTINVSSGKTLTYGGNITGSASLTKAGAGTLVLSGDNGYPGTTTISSGTLEADSQTGNSVGSGSVAIQSGATLSGMGYVIAAVSGAGNIEPGTASGPATLSLGNGLNLSGGGTYIWNLSSNSTRSTFPVISISSGNLTLGGSSKLSLNINGLASAPATNNAFWLTQEEWPIVSLNGSAANSGMTRFAGLLNGAYAAGNFTNYADALGNINLLYLPNFSVFDTLYDSGPDFVSGEDLILTNFSGLSLYVWSTTNAGLSVSNWMEVGQMSEQTLAPGLPGYSRYEINVVPTVSPTFYMAGNMNTGPFITSPVPVCMVTTPDFVNLTVTNIDTTISSSGVLGLLPPQPAILPGNNDANGQFQFQFSAATNTPYIIQASTDLVNWTDISSGTISTPPVTFVDPNATNPCEFYRVLLQSQY